MTDNENRCLISTPNDANYIEILGYKIDGYDSFEAFCEHLKKYAELEETVNRQKKELEKNENIIRFADKTIETANAEIERLKTNLNVELDGFASEYDDKIKAEAYKEFAEKVNKMLNSRASFSNLIESITCESIVKEIDNLLKELVGDEK